MLYLENIIKGAIAIFVSIFVYLFGGWSVLITTLLILNILDMLTGIVASDEPINSKRLFEGGRKKGLMWAWVLVANLLSLVIDYMGYPLGINIANFAMLYYILGELVSFEENSKKLGSPIPAPITFLVEKFKMMLNEKFKQEKGE